MSRNPAAVQRTLGLILVLNLAVAATKAVVAARTGALSVIGAVVESALDAMNNVIAMLLVALAASGPDEEHPYGHAKFETLGAHALADAAEAAIRDALGAADVTVHVEPV